MLGRVRRSGGDVRAGAFSPRARRTSFEGAFCPRARRTSPEGAFRWAAGATWVVIA
jgi:hypothetical protein